MNEPAFTQACPHAPSSIAFEAVASVLVYIESAGDKPAATSLEVLGEARRISTALGAALYAFAPVVDSRDNTSVHTELVTALGTAGADKVLLMTVPDSGGPARWDDYGLQLFDACDQVRPMLVLMAANNVGRNIAPRLAAKIGAAFVAEPSIERGATGDIVFSRSVYGGTIRRRLSSVETLEPIVATVTPGCYRRANGWDEAEVMFIKGKEQPQSTINYVASDDDPDAPINDARTVVVAGGGVKDKQTYDLLASMAEALGAQLVATRRLCERGIAPAEREVGVGARHVRPNLLIVCGASGSSGALGAVATDAEIVAINCDADAPIFHVASYGLVGKLEDLLPELIEALRARKPMAATS